MTLIDKILQGTIKLRDLEKNTEDPALAAQTRREYLTQKTGAPLKNTGSFSFDLKTVNQFNTENVIGGCQIPVGITSPLKVNGQFAQDEFYVPLATTEKSLIASIARGCKAITDAGGATTLITKDSMTRAPIFRVKSITQAQQFADWLRDNFAHLQKIAAADSRFTKLVDHRVWIAGRNVFVRFEFETGDAMGMNMATKASDKIGRYIDQQLDFVTCLSVSGNMCVDKKASALNLIEGRGKSVLAEVLLPRELVQKILKTTPQAIAQVAYSKNLVGSAYAGNYGFNAHFANIVSAIFIATGQDPAHAVEGSQGFSLMEVEGEDLHASVTLPSVEAATVGGGTRLPTQQECLQLLGCLGAGEPAGTNAKKLAEIIAATVLAGELSLLAAEAEHHLADAHKITAQ